jgi:hypothetical protein
MKKTILLRLILSLLLLPMAIFAAEQPAEILLWPSLAPGSEGQTVEENVRVTDDGEHVISKEALNKAL